MFNNLPYTYWCNNTQKEVIVMKMQRLNDKVLADISGGADRTFGACIIIGVVVPGKNGSVFMVPSFVGPSASTINGNSKAVGGADHQGDTPFDFHSSCPKDLIP